MVDRKRLAEVNKAVQFEKEAVNKALNEGKVAIIDTFCGRYQVTFVTDDWWYCSHPEGQEKDFVNSRSWAGCNDGTWANIMKQLGLKRHPLFA